MPALFAYLIALGLLLGTGYGALNWLAQPEPVKVAAKAKPKAKLPPPALARSEQIAEASPHATKSAEATAPTGKSDESSTEARSSAYDREKAPSPRDQQTPPQAEPSLAAVGQARAPDATAPTPVVEPTPVKEIRAANAEISADEARRKAEQTAKPAVPADPARNLHTNTPAPAPPERTARRRHSNSRQASNHGDRRALAVMTLRTIEFPDGRRITQLIPYGGGER